MMFFLFAVAWLVSPIVLLILFSIQINRTNDLRQQNRELQNKIMILMEERKKYVPNEENASASEKVSPAGTASAPVTNSAAAPNPASVPNSADVPDPASVSDTTPAANPVPAANYTPVQNFQPAQKSSPLPYDMPYLAQIPAQNPENQPGTPIEGIQGTAFRNAEKAGEASGVYASPQNYPGNIPSVKEKKSVSTINIILILGAMLISLAGFIFASAAWASLNMFFKTALLLSFSALFFGIHSLAERKLKLEQTGRVFYILGSIFLPAAIAAAGFLNVFGEYFSFSGGGRAAVFSAMFFSVCVTFFKGAHDYKFRAFAAVSFAGFSASVVSLMWQISPSGDVTALLMAVFALAVILTEPLVVRLFAKAFGEESIFLAEWKRFSSLNAWVLSIISLFAAKAGIISLAAFAIFSVCFLRKTFTDKDGTAGTIAFAFFIVVAMFTGFEPDAVSEFTLIIAAVSLIYAVLSAMGIFRDTVRLIMKILAIASAGIAALIGLAENIEIITADSAPSFTLVFAAAVIFVQLLILALRNRTGEYKGMSFGAMLWFSAEIMLFVTGNVGGRPYTFAAAYGFMLVYFVVTRFTKLRERLYSPVNDIIMAVYAFICGEICAAGIGGTEGGAIGLGILLAGVLLSVFSGREKLSAVISPVLTALSFFPLIEIFYLTDVLSVAASAAGTVVVILCAAAAALLFVPKANKYAKSYAIAAAASVPVFVLISLAEWKFYCIPMLAVNAYMVIYLFRHAFPRERYSHVDVLFSSIILTAFFAGANFTETVDMLCFPAVAFMLIFAVYIIASSMGGFEKIGENTEKFLWLVMPTFAGIILLIGNHDEFPAVVAFGAILALCAVFLSMFRRNTMNLIFPLASAILILADDPGYFGAKTAVPDGIPIAVFAAVLALAGRMMFGRKLFEKQFSDIFSIGAVVSAGIFLMKAPYTRLKVWIAILMLGASVANLIRKEHSARSNKILVTVTAAFLFPVWWTIPFFDVPELIGLEFNLLPAVIFCVLLRLIWREAPEMAYNFSFVTAIVCLALLFIGALSTGESFDSVFIGVVLLIMLAVSFIIKRKRWFVLAVTSMVISAALLSIRQLESIAWLVYLVLTGAALIALGVVNEIKKQQKRSGEETKLTRFMSDWTW